MREREQVNSRAGLRCQRALSDIKDIIFFLFPPSTPSDKTQNLPSFTFISCWVRMSNIGHSYDGLKKVNQCQNTKGFLCKNRGNNVCFAGNARKYHFLKNYNGTLVSNVSK